MGGNYGYIASRRLVHADEAVFHSSGRSFEHRAPTQATAACPAACFTRESVQSDVSIATHSSCEPDTLSQFEWTSVNTQVAPGWCGPCFLQASQCFGGMACAVGVLCARQLRANFAVNDSRAELHFDSEVPLSLLDLAPVPT